MLQMVKWKFDGNLQVLLNQYSFLIVFDLEFFWRWHEFFLVVIWMSQGQFWDKVTASLPILFALLLICNLNVIGNLVTRLLASGIRSGLNS